MEDKTRKAVRKIAVAAVRSTGGNPWRAYELAKRQALELLAVETPHVRDCAIRQIAKILNI